MLLGSRDLARQVLLRQQLSVDEYRTSGQICVANNDLPCSGTYSFGTHVFLAG